MNQRVSLDEMLMARENRAAAQKAMLEDRDMPLISFTLNIPGEFKVFPLAEKAFETGKALIFSMLSHNKIAAAQYKECREKTGLECLISADGNADFLKGLMMEIEEGHPLGRLFDIDVLDHERNILNGAAFGRAERKCLICGKPVWACSRNRAHQWEDLAYRVTEILSQYYDNEYAEQIAQKAVKALITEVCMAPKPGLVDRRNNGAHKDMDVFTFINSATSLFSYFREVIAYSISYEGAPERLLQSLRFTGRLAEAGMLAATKGVNTHKGAIFSLGILCAAMGYLYGKDIPYSEKELFSVCAEIARASKKDFEDICGLETNGERIYKSYGLTGIRGEAAAGFPHVRDTALPVLREYFFKGYTFEQAGVIALLQLIAVVDDTNIISRSSHETLQEIQKQVSQVLSAEKDALRLISFAEKLNGEFIEQNISPGGCADLLAAAIFVFDISSSG